MITDDEARRRLVQGSRLRELRKSRGLSAVEFLRKTMDIPGIPLTARRLYGLENGTSSDVIDDTTWTAVEGVLDGLPDRSAARSEARAPRRTLASMRPELVQEWDYSRNAAPPENYKVSDTDEVWWVCRENFAHTWSDPIDRRARKRAPKGCPWCNGYKVMPEDSLAHTHPDLAAMWDYSKNPDDVGPENVKHTSQLRYYWTCAEGHTTHLSPYSKLRTKNLCSICTGYTRVEGVNDLATTHPEHAATLNEEASGFAATEVTAATLRVGHWNCDCGGGRVCTQIVRERCLVGRECAIKKGHRLATGVNDLRTLRPDLAAEWDYEGNGNLRPEDVAPGTGQMLSWVCSVPSHPTFRQTGYERHKRGSGCPYCAGRYAVEGETTLAATRPDLAKEMSPKNPEGVTPETVTTYSHKRVLWDCDTHGTYEAYPYNRAKGQGCPSCHRGGQVSTMERELSSFVKSVSPCEVMLNVRGVIGRYELDIYIPDKNLAIEFNGVFWHSEGSGTGRTDHLNKYRRCQEKGIDLLVVWEDDWLGNRELVENHIRHRLGVSAASVVYARNCVAETVPREQVVTLLEENHIQGYAPGSLHTALRSPDGEIVAAVVWKFRGADAHLVRYGTDRRVVGGLGKLLSYSEPLLRERGAARIVTYSDNQNSSGGLYSKLGFGKEADLDPNYSYVGAATGWKRESKYLYRLRRFRSDDNLLYAEGWTEKTAALNNRLYRVWDYGKCRWVKAVDEG